MRVFVPYVELAAGVAAGLNSTGMQWDPIPVSHSDDAYWATLADMWDAAESFTIVEHDVIIQPDTIAELALCEREWCSFLVPYFNGPYAGLGCVKFTTPLIRRNPDALNVVAGMSDPSHEPKHFCRLDAWLQQTLGRAGEQLHIHDTILGHVRPYDGPPQPSHGCHHPETA